MGPSDNRISFRAWETDDAPQLAHLANDPAVAQNMRDAFPHPYAIRDAESFIAMCRATDKTCDFAIVYDGRLAGGIGFIPGEDVHRISAEIGYWLGRGFRGRGIAGDAVRKFSAFVFSTTDIIYLHAGVFTSNPASARVLEKAGYRYVGRMHDCAVKRGRVLGLDCYELCTPQAKNPAIP